MTRSWISDLLDWVHFRAEADTQQYSTPEAQSGGSTFVVKAAEKPWLYFLNDLKIKHQIQLNLQSTRTSYPNRVIEPTQKWRDPGWLAWRSWLISGQLKLREEVLRMVSKLGQKSPWFCTCMNYWTFLQLLKQHDLSLNTASRNLLFLVQHTAWKQDGCKTKNHVALL